MASAIMEGRPASIRAQVLALLGPPWIDEDEVSWTHEDVEMIIPNEDAHVQDDAPV